MTRQGNTCERAGSERCAHDGSCRTGHHARFGVSSREHAGATETRQFTRFATRRDPSLLRICQTTRTDRLRRNGGGSASATRASRKASNTSSAGRSCAREQDRSFLSRYRFMRLAPFVISRDAGRDFFPSRSISIRRRQKARRKWRHGRASRRSARIFVNARKGNESVCGPWVTLSRVNLHLVTFVRKANFRMESQGLRTRKGTLGRTFAATIGTCKHRQ